MSKTIVFPEPFESKLKRLRIKTRFVANCKKQNPFWLRDVCNGSYIETNWKTFVNNAFIWSETVERSEFWVSIYNTED